MAKVETLQAVARTLLAGELDAESAAVRAGETLGKQHKWLTGFAKRFVAAFAGRTRPREQDVVDFLLSDAVFMRQLPRLGVARWMTEPQQMRPVDKAHGWDLPSIVNVRELAQWLAVSVADLEWFADLKGLLGRGKTSFMDHYHYRLLTKQTGTVRVIEAPKTRLKELQQQILREILDRIPLHPVVHGFRRGRSIKTFVAGHTRQRVVLRMDLENFFPSISRARVQAFFRTAGYPEAVADLLGGICTNRTPRAVLRVAGISPDVLQATRSVYDPPHLPQGAPTSPALANLCAYRTDCRLAGLALVAGAFYTRYADDLAFSGGEEFEGCVERFSTHVAAILMDEGFQVHHRKTRIMRQGVRQHLAGLVVNAKPNIRRTDYDQLKAILTNCLRHGGESQNREGHANFRAHLEGRVSFVEMIHAEKGLKLWRLLEQVNW